MGERKPAVEMTGISKHFGGIYALRGVSLRVGEGSIHALLGENGAGKSTLMKILCGLIAKDEGEIRIDGKPVEIRSYSHSQELGIAIVPQELSLVESFTAAENIYLGREPMNAARLLDKKQLVEKARELFRQLRISIDPALPVSELSVSEKQMVVIAKVLSLNARVLIMDEPTARLGHQETEDFLEYMKYLRSTGKSIVYISHKLEEIFQICDEVTVLRDGGFIGSHRVSEITTDLLIEEMVNRSTEKLQIPRTERKVGDEVLRAEHLHSGSMVRDASFQVRQGEIMGFYGLIGSGRTEMIRALLGVDRLESGQVFLEGKPVRFRRVSESLSAGLVLVPEERRQQGLVMSMTIRENSTMSKLKGYVTAGLIRRRRESAAVEEVMSRLKLAYNSVNQKVSDLSGGNQQKVVLSKYVDMPVRVFIFDEPTRGIDVGAKSEIYALIDEIAARGTAVILISSEIPELQAVCDRVVVMREGQTVARLEQEEFQNAQTILKYSIGGS